MHLATASVGGIIPKMRQGVSNFSALAALKHEAEKAARTRANAALHVPQDAVVPLEAVQALSEQVSLDLMV